MHKKFKQILTLILILSLPNWVIAQEELSSAQIKKYKNGIFEVVTLKLEDKVVYKEEFPQNLIPFHIRNDKYFSLGTAFLINDNTFVSAAHVFNIGTYSLLSNNYAIRDSKGNIFKILKVEKYSNYRDLIQFTVEGDTSTYHKFDIANAYEEGDVVYTAGNALGEGVIFRKGTLTSFTYEPIDGKWKNIRFSAAASPGNSGGPLLNLNGEVVGIVTQKSSNENLNYALPIEELITFSTETSEFYESQLGESEATKQLLYSWRFSTPLPMEILKLRDLAEKSFYDRYKSGRAEFEAKFAKDIFPNHPNIPKYLKNQSNNDRLSIIDINGNGEWLLYKAEEDRKIKIDKNQALYYSQNGKMTGDYQFILDKPESMGLNEFLNNKKAILDTFLTSMQWNRKVADTEVYISSYGEPVFEELFEDSYGRVWQMAIWNDQFADSGVMLYCLPIPQGVACDLIETNVGWLEVHKSEYKYNLSRIMVSYSAKLSEWKDFVGLPKQWLPKFLRDAKFDLFEGGVDFEVGQFSGNLENLKLTADSNLYVSVKIDPSNLNKLVVGDISLKPNLNEDGVFYVSKYNDLGDDASDNYKDFWEKFTSLKSPYNFEVINEGKKISKFMNLGANAKSPRLTQGETKKFGFLAGCKLQSEVKIEELNTACNSFINGLH